MNQPCAAKAPFGRWWSREGEVALPIGSCPDRAFNHHAITLEAGKRFRNVSRRRVVAPERRDSRRALLRESLEIALVDVPARDVRAVAELHTARCQLIQPGEKVFRAILIIPSRAEQRDIATGKGVNHRPPIDLHNFGAPGQTVPKRGDLKIMLKRIGPTRGSGLQQIVAGQECDLHHMRRGMVGGDGLEPPTSCV